MQKIKKIRWICLFYGVLVGALRAEDPLSSCLSTAHPVEIEARNVIIRTFGTSLANRIDFQYVPAREDQLPSFSYEVGKDKRLKVTGETAVSLCKGFYTFLRATEGGIVSWSGNRCVYAQGKEFPTQEKVITVSPVQNHYYFNAVSYAYTTPYWTYARWEKEMDWMAFHGVNMPLMLLATEAISTRVWKQMGLSQEEIESYYVGPAHLPFHRMGLISGFDGTLSPHWNQEQIALTHLVLKRMRGLGMKPICQAFAGFIPKGIKRLHPEAKTNPMHWGGWPKQYSMDLLSPDDPLFATIGKAYLQEWEKEFGKGEYYLADSFNEMEIPVPKDDKVTRYKLLAQYGKMIYEPIQSVNPDAVWVMQGWMFGYQRHIWDAASLEALVSQIPNEKILLLDLAADYNKHYWRNGMNWDFYSGFFGKRWIYSVIPNMGGKTGFTGILSFYANGHLEALRSSNRGQLNGIGMAPEGIENNEMLYEILTDAAWRDTEIDINDWLRNYATCRYGLYPPALEKAYQNLLKSSYGTFTDHPRFSWQRQPTARKGSMNLSDSFFLACESFVDAFESLKDSPLYCADVREWMAFWLGGKMELFSRHMVNAASEGDVDLLKQTGDAFFSLGEIADKLLSGHPYLHLNQWVNMAASWGGTPQETQAFVRNARRIVSTWGCNQGNSENPNTFVQDYSARMWSGLILNYYLPRWRIWFNAALQGTPSPVYQKKLASTQNAFVSAPYSRNLSDPNHHKPTNSTELLSLINQGLSIGNVLTEITQTRLRDDESGIIGEWKAPVVGAPNWQTLDIPIPEDKITGPGDYRVIFRFTHGNHALEIKEVSLLLNGKKIMKDSHLGWAGNEHRQNVYALTFPHENNLGSFSLRVVLRGGHGGTHSHGAIILKKK